jgi:serine/threonine protein kinase
LTRSLVGSQVGNYAIEEEIGRGGMGVVYRARDLALQRDVALKVLAPGLTNDSTARSRFQREIKSAVAMEHPHVVPVYDAGFEDGRFYLAMRYVRGRDLWHVLEERGPLPEVRAMRLVGQIASALSSCHEQGVIHRDVKPQNVLVWNAGGDDEHAFLTDFGIAKAVDEVRRLTSMGALGTRGYMAPELVDGAEPTPACDQYSLACVAFELLTGHLPFSDDDDVDLDFPRPLALYAPGTSASVRETVERGLARDPNKRFPDVRSFVHSEANARESFERSHAITDTVNRVRSDSALVTGLYTEHGLTDARIAEIAGLEKSHVVQIRRRAARRSLVGE